jgi:phenylalanyl-tRNA synthetase beta chain
MKISFNWLKNYVSIDLQIDEISKILTDTGLEVESVEKMEAVQGGLEGVVIGKVLTCEKHPDADKLKVTTVDIGTEILQIVCGASNVAAGQKVVVATVGCTLYPKPDEAFKIKAAKIRGVESFGMLCAEDELGLGTSHEGILVLPDHIETGSAAASYFDLEDDFQIEIGLTPNRSDAMGHIGVARDLVAYFNFHQGKNASIVWPEIAPLKAENTNLPIEIAVEDTANCDHYCGVTIANVKVQASPEWLQKRLRSVGLSPINNVVDVTNFVMRELGSPLHAFDVAKLNGKIVVKRANEGQVFKTLDGVERTLKGDELMITNGTENLCIAGVFGGADSGINEQTQNVFLESAVFNAVSVRKTAKSHGLNTDASFRFERGVDPELTLYALRRAALLIKEIAGGEIAMDENDLLINPVSKRVITVNLNKINRLIGSEIPKVAVVQILENLDFKILNSTQLDLEIEIPSYRTDVHREADVTEEILRIYGFNLVPIPEKWNISLPISEEINADKLQATIAEFLVGKGFNEALNNSLTKRIYVEKLGGETLNTEHQVEMLNPLSQDLNVMRQTLLFGLMENIQHNQNRQHPNVKLFEYGKTYFKYASGFNEQNTISFVLTGLKSEESWNNATDAVSYYTLKGIITSLLNRLGLTSNIQEKALESDLFQDAEKIEIFKKSIVEIGIVSTKIQKYFDIKNPVYFASINFDVLLDTLKTVKIKFKDLPKAFAIRRDFSLLVNKETKFSELETAARKSEKKLLQSVNLFDVYEGDKLEAGKKSYALSFILQDGDRTLNDQEIDKAMEQIRLGIEKETGAVLRG